MNAQHRSGPSAADLTRTQLERVSHLRSQAQAVIDEAGLLALLEEASRGSA